MPIAGEDIAGRAGIGHLALAAALQRTGRDFAVLWHGDCDGERMWFTAGLWGWLAGGALLIGAALGWFFRLPLRLTAIIMAFGSGVLLSALSFDLLEEAHRHGGLPATAAGFL